MTDFNNFERHSPGAEEGTVLALALFNDLLGLLRQKGILTPDDITGLLEAAAHRLSQSPSAFAKRGARFIDKAMLPENKRN